ncbi:MAG: CBU_0592 family membrane protein [Candidatus Saccharibacteria bacterium]
MKRTIVQVIGWYGVLAVLAAYGLSNFRVIDSGSWWYLALNLSGALGIIVEASGKRDYQPVMLNIIWALVAIVMIGQNLMR